MKLRLKGDTVRLRLSQSEVAQLAETGMVEDSVNFAPNPLVYLIHASEDCKQLEVSFLNGWLTLSLPVDKMKEWACGSQVGLEGSCRGVAISIEKDWACQHADDSENQDSFPRPAS
jgi:hypothetical protein